MGRLKWLSLSQTKVSDKGMASLPRITSLEQLYLNDLRLSDSSIRQLAVLYRGLARSALMERMYYGPWTSVPRAM